MNTKWVCVHECFPLLFKHWGGGSFHSQLTYIDLLISLHSVRVLCVCLCFLSLRAYFVCACVCVCQKPPVKTAGVVLTNSSIAANENSLTNTHTPIGRHTHTHSQNGSCMVTLILSLSLSLTIQFKKLYWHDDTHSHFKIIWADDRGRLSWWTRFLTKLSEGLNWGQFGSRIMLCDLGSKVYLMGSWRGLGWFGSTCWP